MEATRLPTGQPAIVVPAGLGSDGMPLAVQLVGRPLHEDTLLQVARQLETARPWADTRPALASADWLDERLMARALRPDAAPDVSDAGRDAFARTLAELRDTAIALDDCRLWACAAAVEATGVSRGTVEEWLDGVMSTPRFLREVAGADLVVV